MYQFSNVYFFFSDTFRKKLGHGNDMLFFLYFMDKYPT